MSKTSLMAKPNVRFIEKMSKKQRLFNSFSESDTSFSSKLVSAVKSDYTFFYIIPDRFITPELVKAFLSAKLFAEGKDDKEISYSYEGEPVWVLKHDTQVDCMDKVVNMSIGYIAKMEARLTLTDVQFLASKLNIECELFSLDTIKEYFCDRINIVARRVVGNLFEDSETTYYTLSQRLEEIGRQICEEIDFISYGMDVVYFVLRDVALPESVRCTLDESNIAKYKENVRNQIVKQAQQASLRLFEQKANIYRETGYAERLTEIEKDNALERYLKKVNGRPALSRVVKVVEVRNAPCTCKSQVEGDKEEAQDVCVCQDEQQIAPVVVEGEQVAQEEHSEATFVTDDNEVSLDEIPKEMLVTPDITAIDGNEKDKNPRKKTALWGILISLLIGAGVTFLLYNFINPVFAILIGVAVFVIGTIITVALTRAYNARYGFDMPAKMRTAREVMTYLNQNESGQNDIFAVRSERLNTTIKF